MSDDSVIARRLRSRRLRGTRGARPARAVRGGRRALGDDASASDAGRASRDGDAAGDPLLRQLPRRRPDASASAPRRRWRRSPEDEHRRWNDFGLEPKTSCSIASRRSPASTSPTRFAPSTSSTRRSRARSAGATRRPTTSRRMRRIKRVLPEARFIHVIRDGRDVTLSTNKRIVERGHRDSAARQALGAPVAQPDREGPRGRPASSASTSRSATRTSSPTPSRRYARSASSSSSTSSRRCSATTRPPRERLAEMAGAMPAKRRAPRARGGRAAQGPRAGHQAADQGADRGLARGHERRRPGRVRGRGGRASRRSGLRAERRVLVASSALYGSPGPKLPSPRHQPQAVPVRGRHEPLGHDAPADDARRPSRADDPAGDPLRPRHDQGREGGWRDARERARGDEGPPRVGRLRDLRRGDARALRRAAEAHARARRCARSTRSTRSARASRATARRPPPTSRR